MYVKPDFKYNKYKVGDCVRIKTPSSLYATPFSSCHVDARQFFGKKAYIIQVLNGHKYALSIDQGYLFWDSHMLEPYKPKENELMNSLESLL